jgi:hypothetical protein
LNRGLGDYVLRKNGGILEQPEGNTIAAGIHVSTAKLRYLDSAPFGIHHPKLLGTSRAGHDALTVHFGRSIGWRKHFND